MRGGVDRLRAYLSPLRTEAAGERRLWTWREVHRWLELVRSTGTLRHGAKKHVKEQTEREADARKPPPLQPSDLRDVLHDEARRSLLAAFEVEDLGAEAVRWIVQHALGSRVRSIRYAARIVRDRGWAALWETPKVVVGTVHSVKGGEVDHVVLAPDLSPSGFDEWSHAGDRRDGVRRMFYVGMTRARRTLTLLEPANVSAVEWDR